ncbi:MAG TPA: hypothetical protein ENI23_05925 [bacterium]|nr:hypothetical protein [bacterium]
MNQPLHMTISNKIQDSKKRDAMKALEEKENKNKNKKNEGKSSSKGRGVLEDYYPTPQSRHVFEKKCSECDVAMKKTDEGYSCEKCGKKEGFENTVDYGKKGDHNNDAGRKSGGSKTRDTMSEVIEDEFEPEGDLDQTMDDNNGVEGYEPGDEATFVDDTGAENVGTVTDVVPADNVVYLDVGDGQEVVAVDDGSGELSQIDNVAYPEEEPLDDTDFIDDEMPMEAFEPESGKEDPYSIGTTKQHPNPKKGDHSMDSSKQPNAKQSIKQGRCLDCEYQDKIVEFRTKKCPVCQSENVKGIQGSRLVEIGDNAIDYGSKHGDNPRSDGNITDPDHNQYGTDPDYSQPDSDDNAVKGRLKGYKSPGNGQPVINSRSFSVQRGFLKTESGKIVHLQPRMEIRKSNKGLKLTQGIIYTATRKVVFESGEFVEIFGDITKEAFNILKKEQRKTSAKVLEVKKKLSIREKYSRKDKKSA